MDDKPTLGNHVVDVATAPMCRAMVGRLTRLAFKGNLTADEREELAELVGEQDRQVANEENPDGD